VDKYKTLAKVYLGQLPVARMIELMETIDDACFS